MDESLKSDIEKGSQWKHKKTGRTVTVVAEPVSRFARVPLLHESGRQTWNEQYYFVYDYERI